MGQNHKEVAAVALKRREDAIPKEYLLAEDLLEKLPRNLTIAHKSLGHFTEAELEIIESTAAHLLPKLHDGILSSLEVTKAFCKASAVAQQLVCHLHILSFFTKLTTFIDKLSDGNPVPRSA